MMKKRLYFLAAALMVILSGCKTTEKNYIGLIAEQVLSFRFYCDSLSRCNDLDKVQIDSLIQERYDLGANTVYELAEEGLAKHPDDSVGVFMLKTLVQIEAYDANLTLAAIDKMGPNAQNNPEIIELKNKMSAFIQTDERSMFIDFAVVQPDGSTVKLSDFAGKGKYCLVDFWASWCGPCKQEIPNLIKLYDKYHKKGLEIVSVAVWDETQATIDAAKEQGIKWHQIIDAKDIPGELYGIQSIPQIMLIGPDGTILKRGLRGDDIAKEVAKYL